MDELKFFAGLISITLVVIALLVYFGMQLNRAVSDHASDIHFPLNIALGGNILFACIVAFWICCAAYRSLRPESTFGTFLNTSDGVAAVIIGSIFFAVISGVILERFGYPIARKSDET